MRGRRRFLVVLVVSVALGVAACGDDAPTLPPADDPGNGQPPLAPGDAAAWCAAMIQFDEFLMGLDPAFTDEDMQRLAQQVMPEWSRAAAGAPLAISEAVALLTEGYSRLAIGDFTVLDDPRFDDAFWDLEDFVFEVCDYDMVG